MAADTTRSDFVQFFRSWVSNPMRVSAIAPSGERLALLMTREIEALGEPVIELGPGTGVFTRALLARGVRESDLTLIEFGAEFADVLSRRFPTARVVQMDAGEIGKAGLFNDREVGAVISGLPLLSIPPAKVAAILVGAFSLLRQGGAFYQFTYGPRCPVQKSIMADLDLQATRIGGTVCNLPPASVYRISRRAAVESLPEWRRGQTKTRGRCTVCACRRGQGAGRRHGRSGQHRTIDVGNPRTFGRRPARAQAPSDA